MGRRTLAFLPIVFAASGLSACDGGGDGSALHSGDSIVLVDADSDGPTVGVGFAGSVAMVGDCLGIGHATVIWPHGTTITDRDPLTIEVPGLGQVRVGSGVDGGADGVGDLPKGIDTIPSGCPTRQVIAFFPNS
jgi:hypothetical protein